MNFLALWQWFIELQINNIDFSALWQWVINLPLIPKIISILASVGIDNNKTSY